MTENPTDNVEPMTVAIWRAILEESLTPELEPAVRRCVRRYPIQIAVTVHYDSGGARRNLTLNLTNVSIGGVMGKSLNEIANDTPVQISVPVEDRHFVMNGTVVHCTSTPGGFKLGIQLSLQDDTPDAPATGGGFAGSPIFRNRPAASKRRR